MAWIRADLTAGRRPALRDSEEFVTAQANVALYDDAKNPRLPALVGWAYITTRRLVIVGLDADAPSISKSIAAETDISRIHNIAYSAGYLTSSSKIALTIAPSLGASNGTNGSHTGTWVCPICSFSNELPLGFLLGMMQLPVCDMCGVRPDYDVIAAAVKLPADRDITPSTEQGVCPQCTFANHPDMDRCEMCGAPLKAASRDEDPSLFGDHVRLSFRSGGSHTFHDKLKGAVDTNIAMDLPVANAAGPRSANAEDNNHALSRPGVRTGIRALLDMPPARRESDEGSLAQLLKQLPLLRWTKPLALVGPVKLSRPSPELELEQLSRQILEFVVDEGALERAGSALALHDLYAAFNMHRGAELASPATFAQAVDLWESKLRPPEVELKVLGTDGLRVVVHKRRLATRQQLADWIARIEPWQAAVGVSARMASERFCWSISVAMEELLAAERAGTLCRDDHPSGLRFFPNLFLAENSTNTTPSAFDSSHTGNLS